jgi:hypothetical protein
MSEYLSEYFGLKGLVINLENVSNLFNIKYLRSFIFIHLNQVYLILNVNELNLFIFENSKFQTRNYFEISLFRKFEKKIIDL